MKWNQAWYKYSIHDNMASVESSKLTLTCALGNNCPRPLPRGLAIRAALSLLNPSKSKLSRGKTTVPLEGRVPGMSLLWHHTAKGLKSLPVLLETACWHLLAKALRGQRETAVVDGEPCCWHCSLSVPPQLHPLHSIHKHKALEECFHRLKLQLFLKFRQQHASEIFPALLKSGLRRQKHEGGVGWVSCKPDQEMQENLSRTSEILIWKKWDPTTGKGGNFRMEKP